MYYVLVNKELRISCGVYSSLEKALYFICEANPNVSNYLKKCVCGTHIVYTDNKVSNFIVVEHELNQ